MNKDTLKMMEKIDDRFIEEALTNDDVECLNESRGVKKYTVMRYAAACLVGLAGIGAAAFGIVKMNGGGKGTENIGIVGEVSENESTKEEAAQKPTIVPNKIVINKSEAPKEDVNIDYHHNFKICQIFGSMEEFEKNVTYMSRQELFQYYGIEKFEQEIDGIVADIFGDVISYQGTNSMIFQKNGPESFGVWENDGLKYDRNILSYCYGDTTNPCPPTNIWVRIGIEKETSEEEFYNIRALMDETYAVESEESEILGKKVVIYSIFKQYSVLISEKGVTITIEVLGDCSEETMVRLIEEIIQKGLE